VGFVGIGALILVGATAAMAETNPPDVTVNFPNGGESFPAGSNQGVVWTATDDTAVIAVDVYYRDGAAEPWTLLARDLDNTGVFYWYVHNTPCTDARIRVVARDPDGNVGEDMSDGDYTIVQQTGGAVATTLRDFELPGTQPLDTPELVDNAACYGCHRGVDIDYGPGTTYMGTMMHNALRDPIFLACLTIAEQDAPSSGDLCIRCHSPKGWLGGRSTPTDGSELTEADHDGVACNFCHRMVDPIYEAGHPSADPAIIAALADVPDDDFGTGTYVVDPEDRRRGPYGDGSPPHLWAESPYHRESEMCATCHNVSNPVFERVSGADYAPGPLDEPIADMSPENAMPLERTYSEWLASDFVAGVYAPEFAGVKPDGIVSSCQDCHMPDAVAKGCVFSDERDDLGSHELVGGNYWAPGLISQLYPEIDPFYTNLTATRAIGMLQKSAVLGVNIIAEADSFRADVTVTNRTGHKLPTGYPEGRRMWLNVQAYDIGDNLIYQSGGYDVGTGVLTQDDDVAIYEAKMGISPGLADAIGLASGESFHFVLNDSLYKDNRIPPMGFDNVAFDAFGGKPVEDGVPGDRYADGQNWDLQAYGLPTSTVKVITTLYYQTVSKEYIEFLRDENTTDTRGDELFALWENNNRSAPVAMEADTTYTTPVSVPGQLPAVAFKSAPTQNPFKQTLSVRVDLQSPADVGMTIFDVQGRRVASVAAGTLGGGAHRVTWDGRDAGGNDAGAGVYFVRIRAGGLEQSHRVIRL
jgi:hypothetical protein